VEFLKGLTADGGWILVSERTMFFLGKDRGADLNDKLEALIADVNAKARVDMLYQILTVLDSKATGLLTVDALLGAILVGVLALPSNYPIKQHVQDWGIWTSLILTLLSAFLCLLVVRVRWSFLGRVNGKDFRDEIKWLANVVYDRTHYYWWAWWLALFGLFAAPAGAVIQWFLPHC
jgi:hypothetical protein